MKSHKDSTFHQSNMDQMTLSRNLSFGFLFLLTVVSAGFVLKTGNTLLMMGLVALPFVLMLMNMPVFTLILALWLDATLIPIPSLASSTLGYLAKGILAVTFVLAFLMGKRAWFPQRNLGSKMVVLYMFWLFVLMAVRGAGLRIFGSETWGGTRYIAHFVSIVMFFALNGMRIKTKYIRWIAYGSLVAGFLGALLLAQGYVAGEELMEETTKARLSFLRPLFLVLFPVIMALRFKRLPILRVLLLAGVFLLVAATGFRSLLVGSIAILCWFGFFKVRNKVGYTVVLAALGVISWVVIIAISPHLPLGMQRAVSFVPGAHIDNAIAMDASGSIEWRIEIWKYCLSQAKEYLIIGRGMAFDVMQVIESLGRADYGFTPWFAYQTHAYHSGPLALLIDFGIPGTIIYVLFSGYALRRFWGYARRLSRLDTFEARYALFQCIVLLWNIVSFYLIFGSLQRIAEQIFLYAIVTIYAESVLQNAEEVRALSLEQQKESVEP